MANKKPLKKSLKVGLLFALKGAEKCEFLQKWGETPTQSTHPTFQSLHLC